MGLGFGKHPRSLTDLLPILHASHATRSAALHSHWVSMGARRSVALARVAWPLLSPRRGALLGLLGVWASPSIRLASHLPHRIHGARSLTERRKDISWTCHDMIFNT